LQRQRLVLQHPIDDDLAGGLGIETMLRHEIAAVRDDSVGILHHFEMLVLILAMYSHAFADDIQEVDNTEWPVAFVGAKLAMIGVVNRSQSIDIRRARRFQLIELQLPLVGRKQSEIDTLQPDGRLS
jgi:hypothetical protein